MVLVVGRVSFSNYNRTLIKTVKIYIYIYIYIYGNIYNENSYKDSKDILCVCVCVMVPGKGIVP